MRATITACATALLMMAVAVSAVRAQAPAAGAETATQFYMRYLTAFDKATKIEDVLPFMSDDMRKQIDGTPADQRPQMFGMLKMMAGMNTGIKVTKETRTARGATLTAQAVDPDKKPVAGTIDIVRENGAWKLSKESWQSH
jgi:hypothetical protein